MTYFSLKAITIMDGVWSERGANGHDGADQSGGGEAGKSCNDMRVNREAK